MTLHKTRFDSAWITSLEILRFLSEIGKPNVNLVMFRLRIELRTRSEHRIETNLQMFATKKHLK